MLWKGHARTVDRARSFGVGRHLLCSNLAQAVDGCSRVKNRNRDFRDHAGDDGGFALGASINEHGEHNSLEES